ncbi:MAG: beta-N-acetylhexosaminidase [Acidobacteriota bacterium]
MIHQIKLSIGEKIGQLFLIGIGGEYLTKDEENFIAENNIGFVILFSRNISSPEQVRSLTDHIHSLGKIRPLIFIDQEGGLVIRLGETGSTVISHMGLAATGEKINGKKAASIIGGEMKSLGIDGVFAPVLDVNSEKNNPVIGIRAFSDIPEIVADYGIEFAEGLREEKIIPCGKHYPGHGYVSSDSHLEIPQSEIDIHYLFKINLHPFKKLFDKNIEAIMSAHVFYPEINDEIGTFSQYFTEELLREELGFEGVVFSDCLEMNAVKDNYTEVEILDKILSGGVDVMSISKSLELQKKLYKLLMNKIKNHEIPEGKIESSLERIIRLKEQYMPAEEKKETKNDLKLRVRLKEEIILAEKSITMLRNDLKAVPIPKEKSCLIIDLKKRKHSTDFSTGSSDNRLKDIADKYLVNHKILEMGQIGTGTANDKDEKILQKLKKFDHVIIFDFSFSPEMQEKKGVINKILSIRKDAILVASESPYIIADFPEAKTILLTYGSRDVQMDALFKILTGEKRPKGKLPVNISDTFSRGTGL